MKRPKNRLHRVIVIGATPAGIAATNKLGELGIPVTLVDASPDLDEKLSREKWRPASGVPLNFAHRSGLIRIMRNPLIRCILPSRVVSVKHTPQGFHARVKTLQTFVDPNRCTLCGRCAEICPAITPDEEKPIKLRGRRSLPGRPVIDKRRTPLCQADCPLGVNAQAYIALARVGKFQEALDTVRKDNVLPGICGRICTHPCEESCRRGELDDPIAIRDIKRFLADYELSHPRDPGGPGPAIRKEKIAIIGSGPAGLASAAELARLGYQVTVFEKEAMPGGMLRYAIGAYRLPRAVLDHEIEYIRKLGVQFINSHPVDLDGEINKLRNDFDALILTTGSSADRKLGVQGEELDGVEGGVSFLNRLYRDKVEKSDSSVAVIGDGNAAFDLARTLKRLGSDVTIVSWFPEDLIPADKEEIRGAREEGVHLRDRTQVISFSGQDGKLNKLRCMPSEPGEPDDKGIPWPVIIPGSEPFDLSFDKAMVAIGQTGSFGDNAASVGFNVTAGGLIEVDDSFCTSMAGVYAAGDSVAGPSNVVEAMAAGRTVAQSVHAALGEEEILTGRVSRPDDKDFSEIPADIPSLSRPTMPERQPVSRSNSFVEVACGLAEAQVTSEAERCLQCGICSECLLCTEVCGLVDAVIHAERSEISEEHAGVVIIADPEAAPPVKGEDVVRAYGPKAAKPDINAMVTRGFAAAAKAMILLGATSQRPRGRGVAFSPPDPELSPDIRLGLFVCRCNDSFGWSNEMDEYVEQLAKREDVVHSEVMLSACVPEGTSSIVRAIRAKGITRVVLASCVCCPLDFVCSACTDQRSRLKEALFRGTGVSRSMVETCNLRGEALRLLTHNPSLALDSFIGLINRSIHRAKRLRPFPAPARIYNFTSAVIGESEAAVNSARTLGEAGLEVFMFGTSDKLPLNKPTHPNIQWFKDFTITGISGTLGDFQIFMEAENRSQVLQVGMVILGEKHRRMIPYIPQEGLPGHIVVSSMQKRGIPGTPFLYPGTTSIAGLFMANPQGINVSERKKGSAAAVLAAAVMPRGPRQSRGFIVVVDKDKCRSCGSCFEACPYQAITFQRNSVGGRHAVVDEALCRGCGNCISVCPSNAADSPYRDHTYLEHLLEDVLVG